MLHPSGGDVRAPAQGWGQLSLGLAQVQSGESPIASFTQFIPCLLSHVSLLQAWEGSGDSSCSDTRTVWP
jgi:hypothetical protein